MTHYSPIQPMPHLGSADDQAARARLVEIARAMLDGRMDIVMGAREMMDYRTTVDPEQRDDALMRMAGIESQSDHIPLGRVREGWSPDRLREMDVEQAECEEFFRKDALDCCRAIIARYSG